MTNFSPLNALRIIFSVFFFFFSFLSSKTAVYRLSWQTAKKIVYDEMYCVFIAYEYFSFSTKTTISLIDHDALLTRSFFFLCFFFLLRFNSFRSKSLGDGRKNCHEIKKIKYMYEGIVLSGLFKCIRNFLN